jgi:hypothetical protein
MWISQIDKLLQSPPKEDKIGHFLQSHQSKTLNQNPYEEVQKFVKESTQTTFLQAALNYWTCEMIRPHAHTPQCLVSTHGFDSQNSK